MEAERDIVQFVPFLEFTAKRPGDNIQSTKARLAKEVLAEVPDQFISYMKARGVYLYFLQLMSHRQTYVLASPTSREMR